MIGESLLKRNLTNYNQNLVKLKMSCKNGQRQKQIIVGSFFYRKNNVVYDYEIRQRQF